MSRGLTLEQLEFLVGKGVTADEMLAFAKMAGGRSKAAERTARWRANKAKSVTENVTSDVTSDGHGDASHPPIENNHTPKSVSDETALATPKKGSRGTRLSGDFEPPSDWIDWAVKKRGWSRADATEEAECFARYWQAKPGREALKLDWPKTWQNWVTNSRRIPAHRGSTDPPKFSAVLMEERRKREAATG